jgi:hypothetical protein
MRPFGSPRQLEQRRLRVARPPISTAFVPPKAKEFDMKVSIGRLRRGSFAT